jgi:hypothetical protein
MKTRLAALLAAMALFVLAPIAGARPVDSVNYVPYSAATATNTAPVTTSSGGTEWYVYALIGFGGLILVGGATYLVYTRTHRSGPSRPVGVH